MAACKTQTAIFIAETKAKNYLKLNFSKFLTPL